MLKLLKMLLCNHRWEYVRYLHGDEINCHDGKRNEYVCRKCGAYKYTFDKIGEKETKHGRKNQC